MNRQGIRNHLSTKHREFCNSITDSEVRNLVKTNSIITGGAITSLLLGETVNDYDLYFTNKETCKAVLQYFCNKFYAQNGGTKPYVIEQEDRLRISIQSVYLEDESLVNEEPIDTNEILQAEAKEELTYQPVYISPNAITLTNKIQLIGRFYGTPSEIHTNYDFIHCTNYWLSSDNTLHTTVEALEAILNKQLVYTGSKYPICSMFRTRKFLKRGWYINAGQYVKMAMQINSLDLQNPQVLIDQLVGVDSSYFIMLISLINTKSINTKIESGVVFKAIEQVFDGKED